MAKGAVRCYFLVRDFDSLADDFRRVFGPRNALCICESISKILTALKI